MPPSPICPDSRDILVVGGAGLVGSHLTELLLEAGATVTVIDNLSSGRRDNLDLTHSRLSFQEFEVGAPQLSDADSPLDRAVARADLVYHLASPIGVARAHHRGFDTTERILREGLQMVGTCLRHRRPLLYTSSSEIYGVGGTHPLGEEEISGFGLQPRWGYGAAKMAVEHLVAGLWREHSIPTWIARFFNVVGPRQNPESGLVVSAFCQAALAGKDLIVHGDGSDRRTFLHVEDAARALLAIPLSDPLRGQAVNVGGVENISIRELAELVISLCGAGRIRYQPYEAAFGPGFAPVQDRRPKLDRLMNATGWRPQRTLEEAIQGCYATLRHPAPS